MRARGSALPPAALHRFRTYSSGCKPLALLTPSMATGRVVSVGALHSRTHASGGCCFPRSRFRGCSGSLSRAISLFPCVAHLLPPRGYFRIAWRPSASILHLDCVDSVQASQALPPPVNRVCVLDLLFALSSRLAAGRAYATFGRFVVSN